MKNKDILSDDDIRYCSQILLGQCIYKVFSNNILFHPDLNFFRL